MTQKFKYYVTLAYLDTSEDDVKFEYIENQAYNAKDAVALAKSYMSQFGNVQGLTVIEVSREQKVRDNMRIYIPCYTCSEWTIVTLESSECNLYKRHCEGYTIFAYNNAIAYNGDNIFNNIQGAYGYINKDYSEANKHKIDVNNIKWKNRK